MRLAAPVAQQHLQEARASVWWWLGAAGQGQGERKKDSESALEPLAAARQLFPYPLPALDGG